MDLKSLNAADAETFCNALADIFEHSPWVAEAIHHERPFQSASALHQAMVAAVARAPQGAQLALIRAHPDLAGKAALSGDLTRASTAEQAGAGLDTLTHAELTRFTTLNDTYRKRFGFPFIIAVKGLDKYAILDAYGPRLENDRGAEIHFALAQIGRIAGFRLEALLGHPVLE
ncbi:MAG: 2-oxo-4-hydroxy-4-carboxy-5-ureidoimidazoline decarboxylase [Pseudomonadota bacterium]